MAPPVLKKKLKKVQDMRTDTPAMLEALDALATFYTPEENTLEARRNLRSDLEARGLKLVQDFIREFEPLQNRIDLLNTQVENIHNVCDNLVVKLESSSKQTNEFAQATKELSKKRAQVAQRADIMNNFLKRFKLSDKQLEALSQGPQDDDGGALFFSALEDVQRIRQECQALISSQFQSAGLELFDAMALFQEQAYEQLYGWVHSQCVSIDAEFPEPSEALQTGVATLAEAPAYYEHARDCISETRASSLARRFLIALQHGGSGTRPIEMHAHDPLRYIGDMLAWAHQNMAVERTLVYKLFPLTAKSQLDIVANLQAKGSKEKDKQGQVNSKGEENDETITKAEEKSGTNNDAENDNDNDNDDNDTDNAYDNNAQNAQNNTKTVTECNAETLDRIFEGVAKPLSGRIQQVFNVTQNLVLAFKLANLIEFYRNTFESILGTDKGLVMDTIKSLHKEAVDNFFALVKSQCDKLLASPPAYPRDLSVALEVSELIRRLSEILAVHNEALTQVSLEQDSPMHREERFLPVLDAFINPLLEMSRHSASGLDRSDAAVYTINNLSAIHSSLTRYDFTVSWVQRLTGEIGDWIDLLVKEQADSILRRSGVADKIELVHRTDKTSKLCSQPGMDEASLKQVLDNFYKSMMSLVMPEFDRVLSPRLRASARNATAQAIAEAYQEFYESLYNEEISGFSQEQLSSILLHSPQQVRQLLDV